MQDTLSDMLVRIKNAQSAKKEQVTVIHSKLNRNVCDLLVDEGFLQKYEVKHIDNKPYIEIDLKYYRGLSVVRHIKRISKPSLRVYRKSRCLPSNVDGFGVLVISTPKGVMSHIKAKKSNLGGEVLFIIN